MNRVMELAGGIRGEIGVGDRVWWMGDGDEKSTISGEYTVDGIVPLYQKIPNGDTILILKGAGVVNKDEEINVFSTAVYDAQPSGLLAVVHAPRGIIGYARTKGEAYAIGSVYGAGEIDYVVERMKNNGRPPAWQIIEDISDGTPENTSSVMRFVVSVTADYAAGSGDSAEYDITEALKKAMYTALDEGLLNCEYRNIGHELTVTRSDDV